jgi:excisionase family DNA binding protein
MSKNRPASPPPPGARFADIPAICAGYGLSRSTIYRLLDREEIRATKVGKRRLICLRSLDQFLAEHAS